MTSVKMVMAAAAAMFLLSSVPSYAKTAPKPRSAESLKCSAEADKKGLKGKPRKSFRAKCLRAAKKAAKKH
jgi:psiF repeat